MVTKANFTRSDLSIVRNAAALAESLTLGYFRLPEDEWRRHPYDLFTRRQVSRSLYDSDVFARVVKLAHPAGKAEPRSKESKYGVVLQDPNILLALLRSANHDLWTLGLYVLTHELIHIVRFRRFDVDFFAAESDREREERIVQGMTHDILGGTNNTDHILSLYESHGYFTEKPEYQTSSGGE